MYTAVQSLFLQPVVTQHQQKTMFSLKLLLCISTVQPAALDINKCHDLPQKSPADLQLN